MHTDRPDADAPVLVDAAPGLPLLGVVGVVGAGALGCLVAAWLARSGQPVRLLARGAALAALQADGLTLQDEAGCCERVDVPASDDWRTLASCDAVLVCVKSAATAEVARQLQPVLGPDCVVLSLQNGLTNGHVLAAALTQPVGAALAWLAAAQTAPASVQHRGGRRLVLAQQALARDGRAVPLQPLRAGLQAAGFEAECVADMPAALWHKLVVNSAWNAVSALTQGSYGTLAQPPLLAALRQLQQAVIDEAVAVARAEGCALDASALRAAVDRIPAAMAAQHSSTAQDLARGRRSEIDHLNGAIAERGAAHGMATPVNQALWLLVRLSEQVQGAV